MRLRLRSGFAWTAGLPARLGTLAALLALAQAAAAAPASPELRVERLGEPVIEPANNYSENTRVRVAVLYPAGHARAGQPIRDYADALWIEEWNTRIFDGLHGATRLPMKIHARDGVAEFTLKSLARYSMYDLRNMPIPQIAVHAGREVAFLQVPQWVDADHNDKTDWLERRVDDILHRARASEIAVVAQASNSLTEWEQSFRRDCGGFDERRPTVIMVSPACLDWDGTNAHRLNANSELTATVLHELRHVWVYRHIGRDFYRSRLMKAPAWPKAPPTCADASGPGELCVRHVWLEDPRYMDQEADAEAFAEKYKNLFP